MRLRFLASIAAAGAVGLAAAAPANAAPSAGDAPSFNIMGPSSCGGWPKSGDISSAKKAVPLNWALGYLSGWAVKSNLALLDQTDPDAVDKWITSYCGAHPMDTLPVAVHALETELEAKLPPPAPPERTGPPMFVPPQATTPPAPASKPARKAVKKKPAAKKPAAAQAKP